MTALARLSGVSRQLVMGSFIHVFCAEIIVASIEGESFHRFSRTKMIKELEKAVSQGNLNFPRFGSEANLLFKLEELLRCYSDNEIGQHRHCLHS
jgi:phosphoribulokinase